MNMVLSRKVSKFLKLFLFILTTLLSYNSSCEEDPTVSPPDGAWQVTGSLGVMNGTYRIYADKGYREDNLIQTQGIPYTDVYLQFKSTEIPSNNLVYWVLRDPDDPATNFTIDPNNNIGNDNKLRGEVDNASHFGTKITDTIFQSLIDGNGKTSVRIKVVPNLFTPDNFYPGDNYYVSAYAGDLNGPSMSSCTMTVYKRMLIECDHSDFGDDLPGIDTMLFAFNWARRPLLGAKPGRWEPNECLYIETRPSDIYPVSQLLRCIEVNIINYIWEDRLIAIYDEYEMNLRNLEEDYPVWLFVTGGADKWWPNQAMPYGIGGRIYLNGQFEDGLSVVFADTIDYDGERAGVSEERRVMMGCFVGLHELFHQVGEFGHCNSDCIMHNQPIGGWQGSAYTTPKFCPAHVDSIRKKNVIIQFK